MKKTTIILGMVLLLWSCTKEVILDLDQPEPQIVVEGSIHAGDNPIITLSRSLPFYGRVDAETIDELVVSGAEMSIEVDGNSHNLDEVCLHDVWAFLTEEQRRDIVSGLGFQFTDSLFADPSAAGIPNYCIYTSNTLVGEVGKSYKLIIDVPAEDAHLEATTTIPEMVALDSLTWEPYVHDDHDSLVSVLLNFQVPPQLGNYIRYWTQRNQEDFFEPVSGSVYDDRLFSGNYVTLLAERGYPDNADIDFSIYPYFVRGDTVTVQWSNIDKRTYDFFFTLENSNGDSPFSSPVEILSNVDGGLGIWAGYATSYSTVVIPKL